MATQRLCSCWLLMMAVLMMSLMMLVPVCEGQAGVGSPAAAAARSNGMIAFNVGTWLELMREKIRQLKRAVEEKRGCNAFPCMYTHLGAKAGRQALRKTLLAKLSRCAHDPSCSPGKRRRRSATAQAVLAMLTQQKATS